MKKVLLFMISFAMLASCGPKQEKVPAIDLANLDTEVSPGEDFYKYAVAGWQKANPLGAEYARFGTFDQLRENNVERLNDLFASMSTMKTKKGRRFYGCSNHPDCDFVSWQKPDVPVVEEQS